MCLFVATQETWATAAENDETQQEVEEVCGPEGKQVERLVAVGVQAGNRLVIAGFIDGINPHITSDEPAEEEEKDKAAPGLALISKVGTAGQDGEHGQKQGDDAHHQQVDGDVGLPRTVMLVHCSYDQLSEGHDRHDHLGTY